MITYEYTEGRRDSVIIVRLDGKIAGRIKPVEVDGQRKWQYFPDRSKTGGEIFDTLGACQRSLETE